MGWKETTCALDERMRFVLAVKAGEEPMAAVCRRFGVSRRVGYKWLGRYHDEGVAGLLDCSRAPLSHPQAVAPELFEGCLAVRRAHPTWGPAKVRAALELRAPGRPWPAASTIGALFDREGLTVKRRMRRRAPPGPPPFDAGAANDVWTIDFKGWFRTGDGTCCDPLTLCDERLHLTLLRDTADPPAATLREQQERFGSFRTTYNEARPHAALGNRPPAELYAPSPRRWDGVLRSPGYADAEVRQVRRKGEIKWRGSRPHQRGARRRADRARRDRRRPLGGSLRPDPARLHRSSRRSPEAPQTG